MRRDPYRIILALFFCFVLISPSNSEITYELSYAGDFAGFTSISAEARDQESSHSVLFSGLYKSQPVDIDISYTVDSAYIDASIASSARDASIEQIRLNSYVNPDPNNIKPLEERAKWNAFIERDFLNAGISDLAFSAVVGSSAFAMTLEHITRAYSLYIAKDRIVSGYAGDDDSMKIINRFNMFYENITKTYEEIYVS